MSDGREIGRSRSYCDLYYSEITQQRKATNSPTSEQQEARNITWSQPSLPSYKLNVDVGFGKDFATCCIGVLIRNERGQIMAATSLPRPSTISVLAGELLTIREGLKFSFDLGFFELEIESDSLTAVQLLCENREVLDSNGVLLDEIRFLTLKFRHFVFFHVTRSGNKPAHILAKLGLGSDSDLIWLEEGSLCIWEAVEAGFSS